MTKLTFELTHDGERTMTLELENNFPGKSWTSIGSSPLTHAGGKVKDENSRLSCFTQDLLTLEVDLLSAFWTSEVGDTGNADCLQCDDGCVTRQVWEITARS